MILKPNRFLKEIGINEDYWLFNEENKDDLRYIPDEEGFVDAEHFSLDTSLSLYIYSQLCYFREYPIKCGTPIGLTHKKWIEIVDAMIEAFKLMLVEDTNPQTRSKKEQYYFSKNRRKKINYGLRLFIKYFNNLWY